MVARRGIISSSFALLASVALSVPAANSQDAVLLEQGGGQSGLYDGSGINFRTAAQWDKGVVLRVKRMIRSTEDHAREVVTGVPGVSNLANWFTLGLFKKALKPKGPQLKATWMAINCTDKTFDVSGDGNGWKNILDDAVGQAEDIYYSYCNPDASGAKAYTALPAATPEVLKSAGELQPAKASASTSGGGNILGSSPLFKKGTSKP